MVRHEPASRPRRGERRLATAVILWSGAEGQGRRSAGCLQPTDQTNDRKTSRLTPEISGANSEEGELN